MTSWSVTLAGMRQRKISTALTGFLVAVGVALVSLVWILRVEVEQAFHRGVAGKFNLVVGPKGSPMQLMLNAVFYLDRPLGNLPYDIYQRLQDDDRRVGMAVPLVLGDNYRGFKIVGTEPKFITDFELADGSRFRFDTGGVFQRDYEAVVGSEAARKAGLSVGTAFSASHGVADTGLKDAEHGQRQFRVTGVLRETGTANDRAIFSTLDSVYGLHDTPGQRQEKVVSAILVRLTGVGDSEFINEINSGPQAQAVRPQSEVRELMRMVGNVDWVIMAISYLVLLAAAISIFVSLYNSMNDRRREIAIIRALGAPARTIFNIVVMEAAALCFIGAACGVVFSHGVMMFGQPLFRDMTGLVLSRGMPGPADALLMAGTVLLGIVSSLIPAMNAYRTEVAFHIRPVS